MVSCVLLSAGLSSRFGSPKALAKFNRRTLIEHLQTRLLDTRLEEILIVLGDRADQIKPFLFNHKRIKVVYNKDYILGQTSSFQAGLKIACPQSTGIMLFPVDYPVVKKETVDQLIAYFDDHTPSILIPSCAGKKGHPPIFHRRLKEELLSLDCRMGIHTVIHHHPQDTVILPMEDAGVVKSFNTPEEFKRILFPSGP